MSLSASAAVLSEISGNLEIKTVSIDDPRADEVLVKIAACGICHTDLVIQHGALPIPLPIVLGHEGAGHIVSVGSNVSNLSPGDPVVLSYSSCGNCSTCQSNQSAYCQDFVSRNFGAQRDDGTTALAVEEQKLHSHFFGQSAFALSLIHI